MQDWMLKNGWSIIITIIGIVAASSVYGYRIEDLEAEVNEQKASIQVLNTQQVQLQVQLAQMSADITYIKAAVDRSFDK